MEDHGRSPVGTVPRVSCFSLREKEFKMAPSLIGSKTRPARQGRKRTCRQDYRTIVCMENAGYSMVLVLYRNSENILKRQKREQARAAPVSLTVITVRMPSHTPMKRETPSIREIIPRCCAEEENAGPQNDELHTVHPIQYYVPYAFLAL